MVNETKENPLEYQVFAHAFQTPGAIQLFAESLPADAVGATYGQHGLSEFYRALLHYRDKTGLEVVDPIIFRSWLEGETDLFEALGGSKTVQVFLDSLQAVELSPPESVVAILNYRLNKRRQLDFLQELHLLVTKKGQKDDEENERISFLADQIRTLENDLGYNPLDNVRTATQMAEDPESLFELPDFLPTQFRSLNRCLGYRDDGGFCKGSVYGVIARSGLGKSTMVKCFVNHWADQGLTTLYVNYEEAQAHWERILLTQITKHNVYLGVEDEIEKARLARIFRDKMQEWGDRFMVRHDPDTPYFDDLERWLRDINGHKERLPDVIVIDTIQSMFMKGTGSKPRWGEFEEMMVRLEKLAKDLNCVLIITAQENANRLKENRDVVRQTDTGGSLSIQQKCAATIFITERRVSAGDDSIDQYIMELQIPKNRVTGNAFAMDPALVRYNDSIKSYEEYEEVPLEQYDASKYVPEVLTAY